MQPDKRAVPEHQVLHRDPAVVGMVEPDEQFWLDISVVQTPETLELFRAAVKPGLQLGDRAFRERLAEHDAFNFDPADIREPFTAPTLLLTGRQDASTGYADVVAIHESFPRATLAVLDRAGHAVAGEQGPLFRALVSEWLDRVDESMDSGLPARELASMLDSDS